VLVEPFRALADSLPQLVFICDARGKAFYFNKRFLDFTGLTYAQAADGGLIACVHPRDREAADAAWQEAIAAGEPFERELRIRSADGTHRWFIARTNPERTADGVAARWYGTLTDIEEQKHTEETLVQLADAGSRLASAPDAEGTLEVLAQTAADAFADWCTIYTYDDEGELRIATVAHKDPERLELARDLIAHYPMQQNDAAAQVALTGEPLLFSDIGEEALRAAAIDDEHYRMIRELGLRSAMILPLRARGQRLGAMSLISAESGRRYTERDLQLAQALAQRAAWVYHASQLIGELTRSQHDLRQLIEVLPQMVWVSHPVSGSIEFANRRWLTYFGIDEDGSKRWTMREFVHPDDVAPALEAWRHSIKTGATFEVEYRLRRHDGNYHWFLARALPMRSSQGRIKQWLGSATDIDEQKRERDRAQYVADTLQQAFIPRMLPQKRHVLFDAVYLPAEDAAAIGGDWYDAFEVDSSTIVFSIGDVAGHGLDAAVAMGNLRQAIFSASMESENPAQVLDKVNRLCCLQRAYVATAIVGFIRDGTAVYSSAGHPPAVLAREGEARFLAHGGMPLGVDRAAVFPLHRIATQPGTLLVLYTDGLTEARREIDEDEAKLLEACALASQQDMTAGGIRRAVLGTRPSPDDIAVMMLRFR
jgi:PAS domain S-box-containing protein